MNPTKSLYHGLDGFICSKSLTILKKNFKIMFTASFILSKKYFKIFLCCGMDEKYIKIIFVYFFNIDKKILI
jgi:hypothetical protein